ncbi:4-(cytidine 5'-diphospho)-2-C-methyl-D-erythritol kinase [Arthrobacter castelli]|uniref:4-(cytidine 5'-diphospho)-2-C-methyl-D-erythritol kinase n=1 Tax=Arthrobacter castelli TaxID=271431 RepID=UPI000405076C|nr:4-(cytidine 5'-diphospho)-2-C-methyl-D-erythritol kinase [Arthrobacter castelli]
MSDAADALTRTASPDAVRVRAPGKINVCLRVGPPRDDGYHTVASIYLAVSLYEEVTATRRPGGAITVSVGMDSGPGPTVPLDGSNLAVRAAAALQHACQVSAGAHLDVAKRVPVAGGMGGGSADAAAALVACNALWGCGLDPMALSRLAAGLGADVPFALLGGAAVGLGTGERLTPAATTGLFHWVLVPAPAGLSTPAVYRELDRMRAEADTPADRRGPDADEAVLGALRSGDPNALAPVLHNDMEPAALALAPALGDILAIGRDRGALAGMISGSGPTVAFLSRDEDDAARLAQTLTDDGPGAIAVHGPAAGTQLLSGP